MAIDKYASRQQLSQYDMSMTIDTEAGNALKNLDGIFAMPYQFLEDTDARLPNTSVGAKYTEKIVSRMPLLFLTPCKQVFMKGFDSTEKEAVINALIGAAGGGLSNDMLQNAGRYYTTQFDFNNYYTYVNNMVTQLCYFSGLGDETVINNKKLRNVNWMDDNKNSAFNSYFTAGGNNIIPFYLDGFNSISESFSNSTTESSLANTINGYSDTANEIKFLLGPNSTLVNVMNSLGNTVESTVGNILSSFDGLLGGMLTDLSQTGVSTIVSGGKIIFPKIWQDSSFNRSYSFDIKLRSPDHDSLSILLNVLIPYVHLLALTLPRGYYDGKSADSFNSNGYMSPFLVKAYCKGAFNIDMGIITDMSVTRGAECCWNNDGLPTQIDVSITIEDLYSNLFMSNSTFKMAVVKNTAMSDFLANLVGLNIADDEFARKTKMFVYQNMSELGRVPGNLWNKFDNAASNFMASLYTKF